ncbi:MAG: eight-cysteine-cluster domain-containing protein [Deltaproteobacteria bacterium]|nr:eight-cysteine-cluster domain-containing protein [Deltaproteobacteria bacterium]
MPAILSCLLVLGCNHPAAPEPAAQPAPVAVEAVTPALLYAQCRDRLEGPEEPGECTTDADCAVAGCSSEVCTTAVRAPDVITTCEVLPCFGALQACGCREGVCSWTIVEILPGPPLQRIPRELPPRVDPTGSET